MPSTQHHNTERQPSPLARPVAAARPTTYDAIVIGAGISGLVAADVLAERGRKVLVLEAADHVGGRIRTSHHDDGTVTELGPSYIGPTQRHMQALVRRFGLTAVRSTFATDRFSLNQFGFGPFRLTLPFSGNGTHAPLPGIDDAIAFIDALTADAASNLDAPWALSALRDHDQESVESWALRELTVRRFGPLAPLMRRMLAIFVRNILSVEPSELSMLFFINYCARCGGFKYLTSAVDYGPDCIRVAEGMDGIARGLATSVNRQGGKVVTGARVQAILDDPSRAGVRVVTSEGTFDGSFVIVATPPHRSSAIDYFHGLPKARIELCKRMTMGRMIKGFVRYRTAWYEGFPTSLPIPPLTLRGGDQNGLVARVVDRVERGLGRRGANGYSGYTIGDDGPLCWTMNGSWPDGRGGTKNPALMFFIVGEAYDRLAPLPQTARALIVQRAIEDKLRNAARKPAIVGYEEMDWNKDPLAGGGPTAVMAPGVMTQYGHALREPHRRVHWAGTETAVRWGGYMEGAVDAGIRSGQEVEARLNGNLQTHFWPEF